MSLQEDMVALFIHTYNRGLSASKGYTQESTDIAINKILDAAVEAVHESYTAGENLSHDRAIELAEKAINKLRWK